MLAPLEPRYLGLTSNRLIAELAVEVTNPSDCETHDRQQGPDHVHDDRGHLD